ncbi:MAG: N-acetylmuramoyl-L-alanine amidase [Lachnospiraceae bacterium]|nr:N-acetylmuramoyl-L-alanine amidase [Lachnospiraceae bacterium]MDD3794501.1 N-acetylmuramoyl-L-alanine amidase [Lachnospiraceae bacterium]
MAKIVIDSGHGGSDSGAIYNGRNEKDDNLRLAKAVGELLARQGVDVVYTRTEDVYQTPYEKAQLGNAAEPDFFVSLHRNSSPENNQYSGVETLVYDITGSKARLAERINGNLEKVGFRNLGVKERPGLVVLRRTKSPAVLVETGFINTDADNALFDEKFNEIAQAIADAILAELEAQGEVTENYYRVQVGAFQNPEYAQNLLYQLLAQNYPAFIMKDDNYYKVQVGAFKNLDNAIKMEMALRRRGYSTYLVNE